MSLQNQQRFDYQAQAALDGTAQPPLQPADQADFERYARHLQENASISNIQNNRRATPYETASVLLLRWEDDLSVADDLLALQKLFTDRYNYGVEPWSIPSSPDAGDKLKAQLEMWTESARPGQLLIVYYVGCSFVGGQDGLLYWAW